MWHTNRLEIALAIYTTINKMEKNLFLMSKIEMDDIYFISKLVYIAPHKSNGFDGIENKNIWKQMAIPIPNLYHVNVSKENINQFGIENYD